MMSQSEYEEKMKKLEEEKKKFEEKMKVKPPLYKRIWFWVTCLRPTTKLEAAHVAQAIVANRQLINSLVVHTNKQTIKLRDMNMVINQMLGNKEVEVEVGVKEDKNDVMFS